MNSGEVGDAEVRRRRARGRRRRRRSGRTPAHEHTSSQNVGSAAGPKRARAPDEAGITRIGEAGRVDHLLGVARARRRAAAATRARRRWRAAAAASGTAVTPRGRRPSPSARAARRPPASAAISAATADARRADDERRQRRRRSRPSTRTRPPALVSPRSRRRARRRAAAARPPSASSPHDDQHGLVRLRAARPSGRLQRQPQQHRGEHARRPASCTPAPGSSAHLLERDAERQDHRAGRDHGPAVRRRVQQLAHSAIGRASYRRRRMDRKRLALLAAILGSFVAGLDATVVNVALPAIERDLGGGLAGQQWVSNAYLLTLGVADPRSAARSATCSASGASSRSASPASASRRCCARWRRPSRCSSSRARCRACSARC